jgi:hypothetical protein
MEDVILKLKNLNVDLHNDSVIITINKIVSANPKYYRYEDYKSEVLTKARERYHALPECVRKARSKKARQRYREDECYRNKIKQRSTEWFQKQKAKAAEPKATTLSLHVTIVLG